jgi:putative transposase
VSPARRRRAVEHLQRVLGVSQRWACRLVGQHRSTQRHQPMEPDRDRALREQLGQFSRAHPRWGYRRVHAQLREAGWSVNRKAVQRLWREEGLRVPARRRKRQRLGVSATPADRLAAEHPDHVWALDYQFDQTLDGRILKLLNVVDEHTREALTITVERRIDADATVNVLDRLVAERQTAPRFLRCDNGPELTANALRDWCRFTGAGTSYIEPGSPWQNPMWRASAAGCETSCSLSRRSAACSRRECWSRTGGSSTTPSDPTAPWATAPRPSTPEPGPSINPHSHSRWTNNRGPVTTGTTITVPTPPSAACHRSAESTTSRVTTPNPDRPGASGCPADASSSHITYQVSSDRTGILRLFSI